MSGVLALLPTPPPAATETAFAATADDLAAHGITTAVDHAASPADVAAMRAFADAGKAKIDIVADSTCIFNARYLIRYLQISTRRMATSPAADAAGPRRRCRH